MRVPCRSSPARSPAQNGSTLDPGAQWCFLFDRGVGIGPRQEKQLEQQMFGVRRGVDVHGKSAGREKISPWLGFCCGGRSWWHRWRCWSSPSVIAPVGALMLRIRAPRRARTRVREDWCWPASRSLCCPSGCSGARIARGAVESGPARHASLFLQTLQLRYADLEGEPVFSSAHTEPGVERKRGRRRFRKCIGISSGTSRIAWPGPRCGVGELSPPRLSRRSG